MIIGSKKVVGILTEMSAEFDAVEYVVTGIGVNVDVQAFPEEIAQKATSLWLESGVGSKAAFTTTKTSSSPPC